MPNIRITAFFNVHSSSFSFGLSKSSDLKFNHTLSVGASRGQLFNRIQPVECFTCSTAPGDRPPKPARPAARLDRFHHQQQHNHFIHTQVLVRRSWFPASGWNPTLGFFTLLQLVHGSSLDLKHLKAAILPERLTDVSKTLRSNLKLARLTISYCSACSSNTMCERKEMVLHQPQPHRDPVVAVGEVRVSFVKMDKKIGGK